MLLRKGYDKAAWIAKDFSSNKVSNESVLPKFADTSDTMSFSGSARAFKICLRCILTVLERESFPAPPGAAELAAQSSQLTSERAFRFVASTST